MKGSSKPSIGHQSAVKVSTGPRGPKHGVVLNGQRLKHGRTLLEMTQREFADEAGIGLAGLRRAEHGKPISIHTARSIAAYLKTTLEWLQSDRPADEPEPEALTIPLTHWDATVSPGALLRADVHDGVPFHGRKLELKELNDWCNASALVSVKLITGAGGIGKTRLLIELCQRLRRSDWAAGFTSTGAPELFRERGGTLVVIDYADAALEVTRRVLAEAVRRRERGPIRVALLARRADDWWDHLASTGGGVSELLTGSATAFMPILAFAPSPEERLHAFEVACQALAKRLHRSVPRRSRPALAGNSYNLILHVHMAALAFIEGCEVKDARALLDYMLLRERRDWERRLKDRSFPERLLPAISTVVAAVVHLHGVDTEEDAVKLMQLEPRLHGVAKADLYSLAGLLHAAYQGPKWLNKLQPDPVGDHLVAVDDKDHNGAARNLAQAFTNWRDGR
jgi:transcriptional regulator with XRE-family HTH domain